MRNLFRRRRRPQPTHTADCFLVAEGLADRGTLVISVVLGGKVRDAQGVTEDDDPEELVRRSVSNGVSLPEIAATLRARGVSPIEAAKALGIRATIHLGEAKVFVDETPPSEWRGKNDELRAIAEEAILADEA